MISNKLDVRRQIYSLKQHHTNILKKVDKMKSKCNTVGQVLIGEINNGSDIMSQLFAIFHESIQDANEDKQYFQKKLRDMNKVSDALSSYLKELNAITIEVNNSNKNDKNYNEATVIDNTVKRLDKMTSAMNSCNSILRSSREDRKDEAMLMLRNLNSNILQIKNKLKQKKPLDPSIRKPPFFGKKSKNS